MFWTWHRALISAQTLFFQIFIIQTLKSGGRGSNPPPPKMKIRVFGLKSKVRGVSDLALRTDFSPSLIFSDFCYSHLEIRGRGLNPPTLKMKIRVFGQKSKVRGFLDLALCTDFS